MQKNVQISADVFIEDLGTGFSYVNFDRSIIAAPAPAEGDLATQPTVGHTAIIAAEQYRVKNPATRERIINAVMQENFADGKSEAALRKGIISRTDPDFVAFNTFAEELKMKCTNEGI